MYNDLHCYFLESESHKVKATGGSRRNLHVCLKTTIPFGTSHEKKQ